MKIFRIFIPQTNTGNGFVIYSLISALIELDSLAKETRCD